MRAWGRFQKTKEGFRDPGDGMSSVLTASLPPSSPPRGKLMTNERAASTIRQSIVLKEAPPRRGATVENS